MILKRKLAKSVWAVGGGKGGTGKSLVSAGLGYYLSTAGRDTVLIDADFGAPNLHTFFGLKKGRPDLGDFISNRVATLDEAAIRLEPGRLRLIKGTEDIMFTANLNHYRKLRILRQVRRLETGHVIMDLGTGSAFNTLDFFLSADPGIVVIAPEATAIENCILFLKSCIVRVLKLYLEHFKQEGLLGRLEAYMTDESSTLYGFFQSLRNEDQAFGATLYRCLRHFRPCLVINKARTPADEAIGRSLADAMRKFLLIDIKYLGSVPYDDRVGPCLNDFKLFYREYPDAPAAEAVRRIASELAHSAEFTTRPSPAAGPGQTAV